MVGEVSEDGKWVWNGEEWVPNDTSEVPPVVEEPAVESAVESGVEAAPLPPLQQDLPLPGNPMPLPAFDPNFQLPHTVPLESQVPTVMRVLSGVTAILMSVVLLLFLVGLVIGMNSDNIQNAEDENTSSGDDFADALGIIQILTFVSVAIIVGILVVSVLSFLGKADWWWLLAAITALSLLFVITAFYMASASNEYYSDCDTEVYYNCGDLTDETPYDQDAMISGYCSMFALVLVGIFSLIQRNASKDKTDSVA